MSKHFSTGKPRGRAGLKDIPPDEGDFFFIRGVGIVPLLDVREAVAEGAVAGHLTIGPEAPGRPKGVAMTYDFK